MNVFLCRALETRRIAGIPNEKSFFGRNISSHIYITLDEQLKEFGDFEIVAELNQNNLGLNRIKEYLNGCA